MTMPRKLGHSEFGARDLYALNVRHYELPAKAFQDIPGNFIACLALDGTEATEEEIRAIARDLIHGGCSYICCWGPDCERVHELIDQEDLALHPEAPWNMSTWHSDVSLTEALLFAVNSAWPDPIFEATTHVVVGISFHNPDWAHEIAEVLSDPARFPEQALRH